MPARTLRSVDVRLDKKFQIIIGAIISLPGGHCPAIDPKQPDLSGGPRDRETLNPRVFL